MNNFQITWYILVGVLLTVYAILDGFDLGVGFWYLFTKDEKHRHTLHNAIGPFWDANEVWLLTGGGALFAAFPAVYASVFSGFYLALMLVLFALIFRAVSFEFRNKHESHTWRSFWDAGFSIGSMVPALLFGVALGNVLRGLPLDQSGNYTGSFFQLLNPFALIVGIFGFIMIINHGALYIALRGQDELRLLAKRWVSYTWLLYLGAFVVVSVITMITQRQLVQNFIAHPAAFIAPVLALIAISTLGVLSKSEAYGYAFLVSCGSIILLMATAGISLFPNLVPALNQGAFALTITNSSSSVLTLQTMFVLALIGLPIVIGYSIWMYRIFWGKLNVEDSGYGA